MFTTSARSFVKLIGESPDEDAERLVFADWLEEQDERDRAEFIRVQCELARLPTTDERFPELHLRQLEINANHELDWLGAWADRLVRWEFRGGLLHAVTLTPDVFVAHGQELFVDHPVQHVALVNEQGESLKPDDIARVVAAPAMGHVRILETAGCRRDEPMCGMYGGNVATSSWLSALAKAEHVIRLEALYLNGDTRSGREPIVLKTTWKQFCQASHLRTLRCLDLSDVYRGEAPHALAELMRMLGTASFVSNLRTLSFAGCLLTNEAAHHLAQCPLENLEELDLANCNALGADGLGAILLSPSFGRLKALTVPYALNLATLAHSALLKQLHTLRLNGDSFGGSSIGHGSSSAELGRRVSADEWTALSRSRYLKNLKRLQVNSYADVPSEALASLLQQLPKLQTLEAFCGQATSLDHIAPLLAREVRGPTNLRALSIPDCAGIDKALAAWPGLAGITELNLTCMHGQDTTEDTAALLGSPYLTPRLTRMDLTGCCQTHANVRKLAECRALSGLRWLGFGYNHLDRECMRALLQSAHLKHVEALHLGSEFDDDETIPAGAMAELAESSAWPRLRDVVVGSETSEAGVNLLQKRFGPRLRVWADC